MPAIEDPEETAAAAGLRYVTDQEPGISRRRRGRGFSYERASGKPVRSDDERSRIAKLAIPPAWTDVWICADEDGHLQATGRDDLGRKQYRYHDRWRAARDADKFEQLATFGVTLAKIRRQVALDLGGRQLSTTRVAALAVRLLDETLVRVGNPQYAQSESFGLTTLEGRHVRVEGGALTFEFVGKSGVEHEVQVSDPALVRAIRACDDLGGEQLFTYLDDGAPACLRSDDVNDYLHDIAGPGVTARDFRTWGGTVAVVEDLGPDPVDDDATDRVLTERFLAAVDAAADRLGNTRQVCRTAYVHPAIEPAFRNGSLHEAWVRSRRTRRLTRPERTTLKVLVDEAASI